MAALGMHGSANATFYHGTSMEAAFSIQSSGFDVSRSGSNAGALLGNGVLYVTDQLAKAMQYTAGKPQGGCILQLAAGNCLHLDRSNIHMKGTWQNAGYDSAHAAAGVLGGGSREEYCIKDPRRIRQLESVTLCDTGLATAAGVTTVTDSAGPSGHCPYWQDWGRGQWLQKEQRQEPNVWHPARRAAWHSSGEADMALLSFQVGPSQATWDEVIAQLGTEAGRAHWNAVLADCPFESFFWETPPLCQSTRHLTFQMCAVRAAPEQLARWNARLDHDTFEAVQRGCGSLDPMAFWAHHPGAVRPSTTTLLVAPGDPRGGDTGVAGAHGNPVAACRSIATFVREARPEQQQPVWRAVGQQLHVRKEEAGPTWVSTDGTGGVHWLHVRLSCQPGHYK